MWPAIPAVAAGGDELGECVRARREEGLRHQYRDVLAYERRGGAPEQTRCRGVGRLDHARLVARDDPVRRRVQNALRARLNILNLRDVAVTLARVGLHPPGHVVAVERGRADHEHDEAGHQYVELG